MRRNGPFCIQFYKKDAPNSWRKKEKGGQRPPFLRLLTVDNLHKRKIELRLMYRFVRGNVDVAEIRLDFFEHLAFGAAECLRNIGMNA